MGGVDKKVVLWNPFTETLDPPEEFCVACTKQAAIQPGVYLYRCLGHLSEADGTTVSEILGPPESPRPVVEEEYPDNAMATDMFGENECSASCGSWAPARCVAARTPGGLGAR